MTYYNDSKWQAQCAAMEDRIRQNGYVSRLIEGEPFHHSHPIKITNAEVPVLNAVLQKNGWEIHTEDLKQWFVPAQLVTVFDLAVCDAHRERLAYENGKAAEYGRLAAHAE